MEQPKHPLKSRTNQFNALSLILYPFALLLTKWLFTHLGLDWDSELGQLYAMALVAAIPIVLANFHLRSITNSAVRPWFSSPFSPDNKLDE